MPLSLEKNVIQGTSVQFQTQFFDPANQIVSPADPVLRVYFRSNDVYETVLVPMTFSANNWIASWDSSNADVGIVEWYISSGSGIAEEGKFRVIGNRASPVSNPG